MGQWKQHDREHKTVIKIYDCIVKAAANGAAIDAIKQAAKTQNYVTKSILAYLCDRKEIVRVNSTNRQHWRWCLPQYADALGAALDLLRKVPTPEERAAAREKERIRRAKYREIDRQRERDRRLAKQLGEDPVVAAFARQSIRVICKASEAAPISVKGPRWVFDLGLAA